MFNLGPRQAGGVQRPNLRTSKRTLPPVKRPHWITKENKHLLEKDGTYVHKSIKYVQHVRALRKGCSSAGTPFVKGQPIFRFTSNRATGETFTLTHDDMQQLLLSQPSEWLTEVQLDSLRNEI